VSREKSASLSGSAKPLNAYGPSADHPFSLSTSFQIADFHFNKQKTFKYGRA
jgi:hypothetical protein